MMSRPTELPHRPLTSRDGYPAQGMNLVVNTIKSLLANNFWVYSLRTLTEYFSPNYFEVKMPFEAISNSDRQKIFLPGTTPSAMAGTMPPAIYKPTPAVTPGPMLNNNAVNLQIFYNNGEKNITLTQNDCVNRVAYCVNNAFQSAAQQLPAGYTISSMRYTGPQPASIQQVMYNGVMLTNPSCDIGALLSTAVANKVITNIQSLKLVFNPSVSCKRRGKYMISQGNRALDPCFQITPISPYSPSSVSKFILCSRLSEK